MAITRHLAELILAEHLYRPIAGRVLLLGRQTVFMTPAEAKALVRKVGLEISPNARIEICGMPHGKHNGYISDSSFFSLFTDADVKACDVTDYEGAEYLFDLSLDPPEALLDAFDFVYNGSVLDNVFDPAACLRNTSKMLKTGGAIFHYEGMVHWGAAYLKMSPDWFFDYYAVNGFDDVQAYICAYPDIHASPWQVFEWSAYVGAGEARRLPGKLPGPSDQIVVAIAQKGPAATIDRNPIQSVYRPKHEAYQAAFDRVSASGRRDHVSRLVARSNPAAAVDQTPRRSWFGLGPKAPSLPEGLRYLGALGSPRAAEVWL